MEWLLEFISNTLGPRGAANMTDGGSNVAGAGASVGQWRPEPRVAPASSPEPAQTLRYMITLPDM